MQECKSLRIHDNPSWIPLPKPSYNSTPRPSGPYVQHDQNTVLPSKAELSSESPSFSKFRKTYFCTRFPLRVSAGCFKCIHKVPKTTTYTKSEHSLKTNITPETPNQIKVNCACYTYPKLHNVGMVHTHKPISLCSSRENPGWNQSRPTTHTYQAQLHITFSGLNGDDKSMQKTIKSTYQNQIHITSHRVGFKIPKRAHIKIPS